MLDNLKKIFGWVLYMAEDNKLKQNVLDLVNRALTAIS